jgi:hypothetical protein
VLEKDLACLTELGRLLETCPPKMGGATLCDWRIRTLLRIRNKAGLLVPLKLNESQQQLSREWKKRNIILKARQLGIHDPCRCTIFYSDYYESWIGSSPGGA